jgi:hypothetical protein
VPRGARTGNSNALVHGAQSPSRLRPLIRSQKERFLRQSGRRTRDLGPIGAALLDNWARCHAKLVLLDQYFAEQGFLDEEGNPRPASRIYFAAANSARLALQRLNEHMRELGDGGETLTEYLERKYYGGDGS